MLFSYRAHRQACETKQRERRERIVGLPATYHDALTEKDHIILTAPVSTVVANVRNGTWKPAQVLLSYSRKALRAHAATNCLTEVMIKPAEAWAAAANTDGPLAGMPVSLKDTVGVQGWDACIGYSAWVGKPAPRDAALVRLLRDAGAVPFVKTNIPITLLSFESRSDVFGRTTNPHKATHSPGGSTGGEAALLAYGGSRIGIGTDVAGSVRVPAHYSGVYTIRASMYRFLKAGNATSMPGQEGVPAVYSPMTRTLEDLETFWKAIVSMKPWEYDHSCLHMPWRDVDLSTMKKLKFGVMWDDAVVPPSPACRRALQDVISTLSSDGYEVVDFNAPSPYDGLKIASQLLFADAGKTATRPIRTGESNDIGVHQAMRWFRLPRVLQRMYVWYVRYIRRDETYAGLLEGWHERTVEEYFGLVAQREGYRERWFDAWNAAGLDFLLTVPNALPAVPHDGMKHGFKACGYSFLFNLLDYTAGVLPITHVDERLDALEPGTRRSYRKLNSIARTAYDMYDAKAMHGLPVGVQVVGRRLEEEKVLEGMKLIERALKGRGVEYKLLQT